MARKILIISGDSSTAQEVARLGPPGTEVEIHPSIRGALASLIASPTDLVIVDDTGGAGLDAAEAVREVDIRVPLVLLGRELLSNVDRDRQSRLGGIRLDRSVDRDELRQIVSRSVASSGGLSLTPGPSPRFTPGPGKPPEGSLRERPVHLLLGQLWKRRATGRLELHGQGGRRIALDWDEGHLRAAEDSRSPDRSIADVVVASCGLPDGRWVFHGGVPTGGGRQGLHPLPLATAGVARAYPPETIRAWLRRHGDETLVEDALLRTTLRESGLGSFPLPPDGETAVGLSDERLVHLFTWMAFGLVRFGPPSQEGLGPAEKREIEATWQRLEGANHYEALGVSPRASDDEIKKAYHSAAKRWHADAFAGRNPGPLVEKIFLRISEAWQALENQEKRAEYDVFLDRKAKGLPTDVESVWVAEEAFRKARALFRVQRYTEAEAQLRQAVRLNPAEAEFWAYLGACSYRIRGSAAVEEAREAFARARALIPQSLVTEYLEAQLEIGEGDLVAAERRLKKILAEKPDHTEAMRDLRGLRERKQKEAEKARGFLGKLLKRK